MNKYMMIHKNPSINCEEVQENWRKLAQVEAGIWLKTYFNDDQKIRFCVWLAPSEETLKNIFTEIGISWESIIPVEETVPDLWGKRWQEHLEEEKFADTKAI